MIIDRKDAWVILRDADEMSDNREIEGWISSK